MNRRHARIRDRIKGGTYPVRLKADDWTEW